MVVKRGGEAVSVPSEPMPRAESEREIDAERESVTREVVIDADPEKVWETLASEEGRERWLLDEEGDREIQVEVAEEPHRLVWWWSREDERPTRVEFLVVGEPAGTRVIVTETAPRFPLTMLACSFALVAA
jgi:uncharacterized protein YndB with AHSA1/START domain